VDVVKTSGDEEQIERSLIGQLAECECGYVKI
jgi:hypothetical protein